VGEDILSDAALSAVPHSTVVGGETFALFVCWPCNAKGNANRDVAAVDEEPARVHQEKS